MKKYILSLFVLVVTTTCIFAQAQTNQVDVNGKRQGYWKITALIKKLGPPWTPSQIVEEGNYTNSMKGGLWIEYFQNGKTKSELTFVNNRPNGPAKNYFENGNLKEEGNWVGSRWTGPYKFYYEDGTLRQHFNYNALGVREGPQTYIHPNGEVAIAINIKDGKEDGWAKEYNTNGDLISETFYNAGVIDPSKTKTYDPTKPVDPNAGKTPEELKNEKEKAPVVKAGTGQVSKEGAFDGEGYWILTSNQNITFKGTFKNYKLIDGEERIYDKSGFCIRVKLYENGKFKGDGVVPKESGVK